jgi:hypothetical protein
VSVAIYLRYKGMSTAEKNRQLCGPNGPPGRLREPSWARPYATHNLVPEAWGADRADDPRLQQAWRALGIYPIDGEQPPALHVPASLLRARLPFAIETAKRQALYVHRELGLEPRLLRIVEELEEFVALAERWELEGKETYVIPFV